MPDPTFTEDQFQKLTHNDRTNYSYYIDENGNVIQKTSAKGEFTPSGLRTNIKTTTMDVGTTATKLPATALTGRNSLEIHNLDSNETLYVGGASVTADRVNGTTSGKEVDAGSFWSLDITDDIEIYGIVATGTVKLKITEVA